MQSFEIEDNCYINDRFIGTTVAKKITVNLLDNGTYNLENKEISVSTGVEINGEIETVPLGNFIIPKLETEEVTAQTQFIGYDYMKKFDIAYIDNVSYPIRLDDYLEQLCIQIGVELASKNIVNSDYMIQGNPFTNNEDCRTVLSNIAQLACGFAKIGTDNKLYIINLNVNAEIEETIDGNNYTDFIKNNIFGAVNSVCLKMNSGVDGEESTREDEEITEENRCQITIADNYFLTSAEERELVIDNIFNAIKGLIYLPCKFNYYGYPWLTLGTKIQILDTNDVSYITYLLNHKLKYEGAYSGNIENSAVTKTQSAYKNTNELKTWKRKTEFAVDKIEGKIKSMVEEQDVHTNKITSIEQDVESIKQNVSDVIDYKRETKGVTQINTEEAMGNDIGKLNIKGNKTYKNNLFPRTNLFTRVNLHPNQKGE